MDAIINLCPHAIINGIAGPKKENLLESDSKNQNLSEVTLNNINGEKATVDVPFDVASSAGDKGANFVYESDTAINSESESQTKKKKEKSSRRNRCRHRINLFFISYFNILCWIYLLIFAFVFVIFLVKMA